MAEERKDKRFVYSVNCTFWGSIYEVGLTGKEGDAIRLPCCPHCGSVLMEKENEAKLLKGIDEYDEKNPGYKELFFWLRGRRCCATMRQAATWKELETGKGVKWVGDEKKEADHDPRDTEA